MVAWSTTDKTANITLSGGNLVATSTSATQGGVRCDTSFTGKLYFEALLGTGGSNTTWAIGWANSTAVLTAAPGTTVNSVVHFPGFGQVKFNNANTTVASGAVGQTARIAIDTTAKLFWVNVNDGGWNNSTTADPATGTGGISLAAIGAGPYFPYFACAVSGAIVTARFGAADMWYPVPSGYSTLDTNVQAFMASSKFLGYSVLSPPGAAVSVSKFLGYSVLAPPQNAVSVSKFLGYAILQVPPTNGRLDYNWPIPRTVWPKRWIDFAGSEATNPNLYPGSVVAMPFGGQLNDNIPQRKRFIAHQTPNRLPARAPNFAYLLFASL